MSDLIVLGYRLRLAYPDVVAGPNGRRSGPASEFFVDYLQTALEPTEVLVEVRVPKLTFPPKRAML
jgi:CO/xanthine dehydrogenase FAD-binding subunit